MRTVKKYLTFSVALLIYVAAISIVLQQFYIYQKAYLLLSMMVSHPTIEMSVKESVEE